jgi:transcriptional regulator with GAF, ATPase, and Fis domain
MLPLSYFRKTVNAMALGNTADIKSKYPKGMWGETENLLRKLNSKIVNMDMTIKALFLILKSATSPAEINRTFSAIMEIIRGKFENAKCAILLPAEGGMLKAAAKCGYLFTFSEAVKIHKENPVADAYTSGRMTIIKNMAEIDKKFADYFAGDNVVSQINIPITDESGSSIGVLNVSADSEELLASGVIETVTMAQKCLSIAIRNLKSYDKMQEENRRLEAEINATSNEFLNMNVKLIRKVRDMRALYDISFFASNKFEISQITPFIIQKITDVTGIENVAVLLEDGISNRLHFTAGSFSLEAEKISGISFDAAGLPIAKWAKEMGEPLVFDSAAELKREFPELDGIIPIKNAVFIPVKIENGLCGMIIAANKYGADINDNDILIIKYISTLFSETLGKINVFSKLEEKVKTLTFLYDLVWNISKEHKFDKIIARIIGVVQSFFQADFCVIMIYDETKEALVTHCEGFIKNKENYLDREVRTDDPDSLTAKAFRNKETYVMYDASKVSPMAKRNGIKSALISSIVIDDRSIGVIRVGVGNAGVYSEKDIPIMKFLAKHISIIIKITGFPDDFERL